MIDELKDIDESEQAECIASHYASISNLYKPVQDEDFHEYLTQAPKPPNVEPHRVYKAIKKMRKNDCSVKGDIHMKILSEFADDFTVPLTHIITTCVKQGKFSKIWENQVVTPALISLSP